VTHTLTDYKNTMIIIDWWTGLHFDNQVVF